MKITVAVSMMLAFVPALIMSAAETMADENPYYLELGKEINGEDAVRDWQVLSTKFPKELGKLQFLPESFIEAHTVVTRLQAGPIADKSKAESICAALFKKNTPCFVIEGLERPTSDQVARAIAKGKAANMAVAAASAPAATPVASAPVDTAAATEAPVSDASDKGLKPAPEESASSSSAPVLLAQSQPSSPWPATDEPPAMQPITNTDSTSASAPAAVDTAVTPVTETAAEPVTPPPAAEAKPAPKPVEKPVETAAVQPEPKKDSVILPWLRKDNAAASVEVDEAIRVPLTTAQNDAVQKPLVNPVPVPADTPVSDMKDVAKPTQAGADSAANVPGWLNVESFGTEAQASGFWDTVHNNIPSQAAGLRVRIIRPLDAQDVSTVTLNVGPFPSRDSAMAFCRGGILTQNSALQCQFTQNEPEGVARLLPSRNDHSDRYAARRQQLMDRREQALNSGSSFDDKQNYWLQVASGNNEIEALQMWEKLRTDNADVLSNVRSSVSAPLLGSSDYQVKIGPLDTNDQAVSLCKTLKSRGVSCSIFSKM